jgi:HrpA-like RNA helicase
LRLSSNLQLLWRSWIREEENTRNNELQKQAKHRHDFINSLLKSIPEKIKSPVEKEMISNQVKLNYKMPSVQTLHLKKDKSRIKLPAYQCKDDLVHTINANPIVIITGETGSGKSTQTPQFLLEDSIKSKLPFNLVITQPRRISAISLANRVSFEVGDKHIGKLVGYAVKNDRKVSDSTCITYCTTGMLLKWMEQDPNLTFLTHLIVDEVHERTLDSDFLLCLLKLIKRGSLKVILMSATLDAKHFSNYFGCAPIFTLPGNSFTVTPLFLEDVLDFTGYVLDTDSEFANKNVQLSGKHQRNFNAQKQNEIDQKNSKKINYELISSLVRVICDTKPVGCGAILVFLPGMYEIQRLDDLLKEYFEGSHNLMVLPLHGTMPAEKQALVFKPPPEGVWKVVLATNVAETGITIPDVLYVIDTLMARELRYYLN